VFDIKWIRDNAEHFDQGLKARGLDPLAAELIALDEKRRGIVTRVQDMQSRRNAASKEIGKAMGAKDSALADKLKAEVAALKEGLQAGEEDERKATGELNAALSAIPNLPHEDVPVGADENDNVEVRKSGSPRKFDFAPKQHFEIGESLGLMDFETAAKISGARFVVLKGALAKLERGIASFMLDLHTTENGYTEYLPPFLVRDEAAYGTGNLPKFKDDLFQTSRNPGQADELFDHLIADGMKKAFSAVREQIADGAKPADVLSRLDSAFTSKISDWRARFNDELPSHLRLWLIPTAEVSLTNMVREEILSPDQLPMRCTAWTPCFRSEAGSAGRDTRGMIRQHQFSKVELVSITTPEQSLEEHERMTASAEKVLQRLEIPYRTMLLCTGDMGFASQKTYDIEAWLPGQDAYREISSCSVCGDFQARRMGARYKAGDKDIRFVHTLNGSGLAVGRTLVAVLENYQQADGSVVIPEALRPYMGGMERIGG